MIEGFHRPVLVEEVCMALSPALGPVGGPPAGTLVDATCGGGGHTAALLSSATPLRAIALDRDPAALAAAAERLRAEAREVELVHAAFSEIPEVLEARGIDGVEVIVADLGVSSHQLDTAERGFSFRLDGPLDMRMDPSAGPTAAEVVASIEVAELTDILRRHGEEPQARRIATAVCAERPRRTLELADLIVRTIGSGRPGAIHPATRTFQALRIHVNRELDALDDLLARAPECLHPGGRMGVVAFHSLEDRRVKRRFRELSQPPSLPERLPVRSAEIERPRFRIPIGYERGLVAGAAEVDENPRARSARLRVVERC